MPDQSNRRQSCKPATLSPPPHPARTNWLRSMACVCAVVMLTGAAPPGQQTPNPDKPYLMPEANRLPDKNDQMMMQEQQAKKQDFEAANAARKKQIADDSAKLLTLAIALKSEVDKTDKDTLSLSVIRKAEAIEKLAHAVREKMKLTVGGG